MNEISAFIPYGEYCYAVKNVEFGSDFGFRVKIKLCTFYEESKNSCKLKGSKVDDMCKVCSINLTGFDG